MIKKMNRRRLRKLAAYLETVPDGHSAAAEFFGLRLKDSESLFVGDWSDSPTVVAQRLREFARG